MKGYELLVDSREKPAFQNIWLRKGINHRVTALDADIVLRKLDGGIEDVVGIERKAVADLVQSIHTKYKHGFHRKPRLFEQMDRMKRCFKICFLMISGDLQAHKKQLYFKAHRKINDEVIYGTLASVSVRQGIGVMWWPDDNTLVEVAHRIMVKVSEGKWQVTKDDKPKFLTFHPRNTLTVIPGVTTAIADKIFKRWPTIYSLSKAKADEIETIDGVGPVTARSVYDLLHRKYSKW